MPSIEYVKLMSIIEAKIEQTEEGQRNFIYNNIYLYRGSNQIIIFIDCNRIKGSFD